MVDLYKGFIKQRVRKVTAEIDIPLGRAIQFLKENKQGIIEDYSGTAYTLEELEDVKSFGSKPRIEPSNRPASLGALFENPDSKLFESPNGSGGETDSTE
jgi:hypothetical protein